MNDDPCIVNITIGVGYDVIVGAHCSTIMKYS